MLDFEDKKLLTEPAALHATLTIPDEPSEMVNLQPTVTVSGEYWNRLMALRGWAREVLGLTVDA